MKVLLLTLMSYCGLVYGSDVSLEGGGRVYVEGDIIILELPEKVMFEFDSHAVNASNTVSSVRDFMSRYGSEVYLSISGHTDSKGSDAYNYSLGGKRASAMKELLNDVAQGTVISSWADKIPAGGPDDDASDRRIEMEVKYRH